MAGDLTVFYETLCILTAKISHDLFLVTDSILSVFCLSLLSEIGYITYMTLFLTKNLYFRKKFIVLCHASNNITSRNIGGRMHGPSPPPQILGDRQQNVILGGQQNAGPDPRTPVDKQGCQHRASNSSPACLQRRRAQGWRLQME